jgi:hypothetical protein
MQCYHYSTHFPAHRYTRTRILSFRLSYPETDISQSHCNFKSHVKSSLHRLIPFLPFLRLPIPRLDSTTVAYSAVLRLLLVLLSYCTFFITTLHGPRGKHVSRDRIRGTDHTENTASSISSKVCLPRRCLVIEVLLLRACVKECV